MKHFTRKEVEMIFWKRVYITNLEYIETIGAEKLGYNAGIYGWNWDVYYKDGKAYIVGRRNFPRGIEL